MNLFHRKVVDDPSSEACGLGPESILHVLGQCPKAWAHGNLQHIVKSSLDFTDISWRIGMDPNNDSKLLDITLMVAWGI